MPPEDEIKRLLYELNPWWTGRFEAQNLFRRERYIRTISDLVSLPHIVVLAGPRRAGKTSLIKILIDDLVNVQKINPQNILYVSFDDPLLGKFSSGTDILGEIISQFEVIRKKPLTKNTTIFIDEIQGVQNWQVWLKKYYDQGGYKFIISGSSVALLKGKFTELTGRSVSVEIYPFSFREIVESRLPVKIGESADLVYPEIMSLKNDLLPHEKEIKIYFEEYKEKGGFPEVILPEYRETDLWKTVLKNYFDQIIYRDIVRMHAVREVSVLENLALYLMQNISQKFSLNNIARSIDANVEIVRTFLQHLVQGYLFFVLGYYGGSLKTTLKKTRKVYFLDMGLRHSVVGHKGLDEGMIVENIIYFSLRDNFDKCYYWYDKNKHEVDFVARKGGQFYAVEVKYADNKLDQKSLKGLFSFLEKKNIPTGFVVTRDTLKEENINGRKIIFIPAWFFCLLSLKPKS